MQHPPQDGDTTEDDMNENERQWGWCDLCASAFLLQDKRLPIHNIGGGSCPNRCEGSDRRPRRLVTDDNQFVDNTDFHSRGVR